MKATGTVAQMGSLLLTPIYEGDRSVVGVAGTVVRDSTYSRPSDELEVVASVSHDLRNPLATLSTTIQVLRLKEPSEELEIMNRAVHEVTRIIDNIVESSWLTHGRLVLQRQPAEIATLVQRATELANTPPLVHIAAPSATTLVDVDAKRLTRSIANLISNAATTAQRGARVVVSTQHRGDRVDIRISTDGAHRDASEVAAVSVRRGEPALRLAHQNARGIVELHGGSVSLTDSPGNLPECVITLPVAAAPVSKLVAEAPTSSKRVLLVEDNDDGARALEAALVQRGYQVVLAHDAPVALTLAKTFKPDVVLLDLGLPVMDGWELATRLRSTLNNLPIVAITALGQPSDIQRSTDLGFVEHFVKPVDISELDRVVRRVAL